MRTTLPQIVNKVDGRLHANPHDLLDRAPLLERADLPGDLRDRLRSEAPGAVFLHLSGDRSLIEERMAGRQGHFMPTALLDSQFATLQPLDHLGVRRAAARGRGDRGRAG